MKIRNCVEVVFLLPIEQFSIRQKSAKNQDNFFVQIISKIALSSMAQYFNLVNNQTISTTFATLLQRKRLIFPTRYYLPIRSDKSSEKSDRLQADTPQKH